LLNLHLKNKRREWLSIVRVGEEFGAFAPSKAKGEIRDLVQGLGG
jgi:hypothetical protein